MIEYKQPAIVAELRRRIQEGIYTSLLPTTAELAAEFGVNVKTMGKAIARLVAEGRLAMEIGRVWERVVVTRARVNTTNQQLR